MMLIRRAIALVLLTALAGCSHKATTETTTSAGAASAPAAAAAATPASAPAGQPAGYDTETAAQSHCPSDQVVWLNTKTRVYHEKGMLYYGHTKQGAYVCRKDADAAGDRDTKNGK